MTLFPSQRYRPLNTRHSAELPMDDRAADYGFITVYVDWAGVAVAAAAAAAVSVQLHSDETRVTCVGVVFVNDS